MAIVGRLWSGWTRARRRLARHRPGIENWASAQAEWVRANAPGRSFADVGGLFDKEGEIAFLAEEAGASAVTCFDAGDPDLCAFDEKRRSRGSGIRFVQGDLEDAASVAAIGVHDVVWCTGVIYHSPNPVRQLMNLRRITGELLYLGTLTIPEVPGFPQACVYYPHLDAADRAPYAAGYRWEPRLPEGLLGIGAPIDEAPMRGYANNWWGVTRSALRAMLRTARFEVVEEREVFPTPYLTELVARPLPADPMLPPIGYFRERGERRKESGERLPFEDYYERRRAADSADVSPPPG